MIDDLIHVGNVRRTLGYEGAVLIEPKNNFEKVCLKITKCLIKVNGIWAPFFVKSAQKVQGLIELKFEDLANDSEAKSILHQEILIPANDPSLEYKTSDPDQIDATDLNGYAILNAEGETIGLIQKIELLPAQVLALVLVGDREILIPLHEDFIQYIDSELRTMMMDLPDGLLD